MAFAFSFLHKLLFVIRMLFGVLSRRNLWRITDQTASRSLKASPPHHDCTSLNAFPPEILEKIFRLTCTDGGPTGCSLSLVSKRVRAVSTAARYHSISLVTGSPQKLRGFLECFEHARNAARSVEGNATPRIRHLCLALYPTTPSCVSYRPDARMLDLHAWLDTALAVQFGDEGWTRYRQHALHDYHAVVQKLLEMVSGDVQSMCLFGGTQWWEDDLIIPTIACSGFPMLTELSISGDEPRFSLLPARTYPFDTPFPALTRLRIVADGCQNVDFQRWVDMTPKLQSMRITCEGNVYTPGWINSLQHAIDNLSETRTMPPRITLLIKPAYLARLLGLQHLYHVAAVRLLKHVKQTRVPLVFVPYYTHQDLCHGSASSAMEPEQLMRADWLVRVAGRQGIFMEDVWFWSEGRSTMDRIRAWWLFGGHYLEPLVHL